MEKYTVFMDNTKHPKIYLLAQCSSNQNPDRFSFDEIFKVGF